MKGSLSLEDWKNHLSKIVAWADPRNPTIIELFKNIPISTKPLFVNEKQFFETKCVDELLMC